MNKTSKKFLEAFIKNAEASKKRKETIRKMAKPLTDSQYYEVLFRGFTRVIVRERDKSTCALKRSGCFGQIEVHHTRGRNGVAYNYLNPYFCVCLCKRCHDSITQAPDKYVKAEVNNHLENLIGADPYGGNLEKMLLDIGVDPFDFAVKKVPKECEQIEKNVRLGR